MASNDVYRVSKPTKQVPLGTPGHGVSTASVPTPKVSAMHGLQHISYKHQKLVATPGQRTGAVNKSRESIKDPNVW